MARAVSIEVVTQITADDVLAIECPKCKGEGGFLDQFHDPADHFGYGERETRCRACDGKGAITLDCPWCGEDLVAGDCAVTPDGEVLCGACAAVDYAERIGAAGAECHAPGADE